MRHEMKCRTQMSNKQIQRGYITVFTMFFWLKESTKGGPPVVGL
jgi:hypothetical protein